DMNPGSDSHRNLLRSADIDRPGSLEADCGQLRLAVAPDHDRAGSVTASAHVDHQISFDRDSASQIKCRLCLYGCDWIFCFSLYEQRVPSSSARVVGRLNDCLIIVRL
ncbi:MAG: hypothetical protein ACK559_23105, partial [bacterium]